MRVRVSGSGLQQLFSVLETVISEAVLVPTTGVLQLHGARNDRRVSGMATISATALGKPSYDKSPVGINVPTVSAILSILRGEEKITVRVSGVTGRIVIRQREYQYRTDSILPNTINQKPKRKILSKPYATATLPVAERSLSLGVQAADFCGDLMTVVVRNQHPQLVIRAVGDSDRMYIEIPTNTSAVIQQSPLEVTYPTDVIADIHSALVPVVQRLHLRIDTNGNLCITAASPAGLVIFRFIITPYELVMTERE